MNKIKSKQTGQSVLSPLQTATTIGVVALVLVLSWTLYLLRVPTYPLILITCFNGGMAALIFIVFIFDKERFGNIILLFKFMKRKIKGDTNIYLFRIPLKKLQKHIPIKTVHERGLIEYQSSHKILSKSKIAFQKSRFGVLFRYDPPAPHKNNEERFHAAIERIINSLGSELEVSFHFYDMIDKTNDLADQILKSINAPGNTLEQKQHLQNMYEDVTASTVPRVSSAYLLSIKFGEFKSVKHAMKAYNSIIPGILKTLQEQDIYTMRLIDEYEIAVELRTFAMMEEY